MRYRLQGKERRGEERRGEERKGMERKGKKRKGKKSIYIALFRTKVHNTKRSGMDHTALPANNTMPAFPS